MVWNNDQVSKKETARIMELAEEAMAMDGDFVEFGCYKGDTSLMLGELLVKKAVEKPVKKLWQVRGKLDGFRVVLL